VPYYFATEVSELSVNLFSLVTSVVCIRLGHRQCGPTVRTALDKPSNIAVYRYLVGFMLSTISIYKSNCLETIHLVYFIPFILSCNLMIILRRWPWLCTLPAISVSSRALHAPWIQDLVRFVCMSMVINLKAIIFPKRLGTGIFLGTLLR
jgi:hypothetical protein